MVVFALAVVAAAYALASLGRSKALPADILPFLVGVLVLFVVTHVVVRKVASHADPVILPLAILLNGIGYVMIARLDTDLAAQQAGWTLAGVAGFVVTLLVLRRVRFLERNRYTIGLVGVVLVILPLVPGIGRSINGAKIWVRIPPFSFQPGEFAKLALAVFFAAYLVERREMLSLGSRRLGPLALPEPKALAPIAVAWGFSLVVMMFERDLGSALLFFVLFLALVWLATARAAYLWVGGTMFAAGAFFSWTTFSHVQQRVSMWLDPWQDPLDDGYQIVQASYALAWGGAGGTGLGRGIPGRIPYDETDFIFAVIGEELGLFGTTAVLIAFLLICGSGFRIATRSEDPFSKLLAAGLTTMLAVQAFVIMAGVVRLLPLTGVTLPFVSYGGSSLLSNWILGALLVRLSDQAEQPRAMADEPTVMTRVG